MSKSVKKSYPVMNMSCYSCAVRIESTLKSKAGVISANVNYAAALVNIEFLPALVQVQELKNALTSLGYDLIVAENDDEDESLKDYKHHKFKELRWKTIASAILSIPLVIIAMFFMNIPYANEIMCLLATPVLFIMGLDFYKNAFRNTLRLKTNMDTLVALSTGIAYGFSFFNLLYPEYWHRFHLHGHVYFETSAVIITFILLGKLIEEKAKRNTSLAIEKLIGLQPKTVMIIEDSGLSKEVTIEKIHPGDVILVRPGDKIPVDGTILQGQSYLDESMWSGEVVPVFKHPDDKVFAGSLNQKGSFTFIAGKVGSETQLGQLIQRVREAMGSKSQVQKTVDWIASVFIPAVITMAIISFSAWYWLGGTEGFSHGLMAAITVLVIACPCALGLATPTAVMVGIGKASEQGILIKDAESLDDMKKVDTLVFDKTGTLTEGKPRVTDIFWINKDKELPGILSSIETLSEHPLAKAVAEHLNSAGQYAVTDFKAIAGMGVTARVGNASYYAGNFNFLLENSIPIVQSALSISMEWAQQARSIIWFADDSGVLAIIAIEDKIKESSLKAIEKLKEGGYDLHIISGDNLASVSYVANKTAVLNYRAELLPVLKADYVKELQRKGKIVAMIGDGINDSPALAQADVSIAMGNGNDIAIHVAKITIISADLNKILPAIKISKATSLTIKQNLFWAFVYNLLGIPVAAGVLYPVNGFLLNPMIAGGAMALSSICVVMNSLRLKMKE